MSRAIVADASVAAKWFLSEPGSDKAADLLEAGLLHAPTLLRVEIASAISRRHRVGALAEDDARTLLAEAQALLRWPAFRFVDDGLLLLRAGQISLALRHPLPDCLYIACAEYLGGDVLTVDPKFLERAMPHFPFVRPL